MLKSNIAVDIYSCKVVLILDKGISSIVKRLTKKHGCPLESGNYAGMVIPTVGMVEYFLILDVNGLSHNTISHEIVHASENIFFDREIPFTGEPLAYLNGYLAERIYNYLKKKNIEVK